MSEINTKTDSVLFVFSSGYNIHFHGTEKMLKEYIITLSAKFNIDILLFGSFNIELMKEFKDMPYRHLYRTANIADTLIVCDTFNNCTNTCYKAVIFNDNVSNFAVVSSILSCLNYKYSYKIWHSPFFTNRPGADDLKNDDNLSSAFDYNVFVSKYDYDWSIMNKPHVYNKDNSIILNNNLLDISKIRSHNINTTNKSLKCIYYGRLSGDKRVNNFISVIYNLICEGYDITLDLYGYKYQYDKIEILGSIENIEKTTNNKIKFYEYNIDIKDKLDNYDLGIIASYLYTNSLVTQEMILAGLPILSYDDVGVLKEINFPGNNLKTNFGATLKDIMANKYLLHKYIIDPVYLFNKFNQENTYKDIIELVNH